MADTRVGTYGLIPEDLYLRKIERTALYENPKQLEYYQRNLLKDTRPDAPFFASDEPRRNYQSQSVINLRDGGRRTKTDPDLPDGLNLNFDPWVIDTPAGPDMQKHVKQQNDRARFVNFYDDSDNSVPESMIAPTQMQMQIKHAMPLVQNRLKIFDTSMDGLQHGAHHKTQECNILKITRDGTIVNINDADYIHRIGNTSALSNAIQLGYRTDVDHQFKIAKYGFVRAGNAASDEYANRTGAFVDHRLPVSYEGMHISPDLAFLMANLVNRRIMQHQIGKDNINFAKTAESINQSGKITPNDMAGIYARQTKETQHLAPNMLYDGKTINRNGTRLFTSDSVSSVMDKTIIDPQIISFMQELLKNKKMAPCDIKDLRDRIEQTAIKNGIYVMDKNSLTRKTGPTTYDNLMSFVPIDQHTKDESKNVFNYARAFAIGDDSTINMHNVEAYKGTSYQQTNQASNTNLELPHQMNTTNNGDGQFGLLEGKAKEKFVGTLGSKYMTKYINRDDNQQSMSDKENR